MKITISLLSFIILFFTGCLLDDEDTATTTAASQTAVAASPPSSIGNSGLSGQTISFNPTLNLHKLGWSYARLFKLFF